MTLILRHIHPACYDHTCAAHSVNGPRGTPSNRRVARPRSVPARRANLDLISNTTEAETAAGQVEAIANLFACSLGARIIEDEQKGSEEVVLSNTRHEQRPLIVLTRTDHERLSALVDTAQEQESPAVLFLREELERATVLQEKPAATSLVTMDSQVTFIDDRSLQVWDLRLVYPDEADEGCISVLSPVGSALIGLGPGQTISWLENGAERRVTVLEVRPAGSNWTL